MKTKKIACFLPSLFGGGAEKAAIKLFKGMLGKDLTLDLVLADATGPYLNQVPKEVRIVDLGAGRVLKAILPLARYLKNNKPDALISHMEYANVAATLAKEISGTNTKLVLVEQNNLSASLKNSTLLLNSVFSLLVHTLYPRAGAIVGVSKGVAEDLETVLAFPKGKVHVIHNPIVDDDILEKAQMPVEHPWFRQGEPPVFVAVGRLSEQKDFQNLIKAFGLLRKQRQAKLIILGEGDLRGELEASVNALGLAEDVCLPGFVDNPYAYMYNAKAFVLSSRWEGLPTVIIEAMACGCPVVSTNCPSGPNEILDEGKYGILVPVGDEVALSHGMQNILNNPISKEILLQRAKYFSVEHSVSKYLSLLFAA
ncbi:MAG: glycosyltransferase [Calothrix sp. C42_A2020_038]|nr:glycosyltransferase [Calothrix sp. C42_A2020_038]